MVARSHLKHDHIPRIPPFARVDDLDKSVLASLGGLGAAAAERVALHLAAAASLMDEEPEAAYKHARTAADRAGRIAVVRETAGIAAYLTGRYTEALRELRTFQRLAGSTDHLAIIADCERGLGRPAKAIEIGNSDAARRLRGEAAIEMVIVLAGAYADQGDFDIALAILRRAERGLSEPDARQRLREARGWVKVLASGGQPVPEEPAASDNTPSEQGDDVMLFDVEDGMW
jgi:tetratricopeptide (TPR) repeat protein